MCVYAAHDPIEPIWPVRMTNKLAQPNRNATSEPYASCRNRYKPPERVNIGGRRSRGRGRRVFGCVSHGPAPRYLEGNRKTTSLRSVSSSTAYWGPSRVFPDAFTPP